MPVSPACAAQGRRDLGRVISELADRLDSGANVTLLCSKDCFLPEVCHRTALAGLIDAERLSRGGSKGCDRDVNDWETTKAR